MRGSLIFSPFYPCTQFANNSLWLFRERPTLVPRRLSRRLADDRRVPARRRRPRKHQRVEFEAEDRVRVPTERVERATRTDHDVQGTGSSDVVIGPSDAITVYNYYIVPSDYYRYHLLKYTKAVSID